METFNWKCAINRNLVLLKLSGIWPSGETYKLDGYTIYAIVYMIPFVWGHNFSLAVTIFYILDDLQLLVNNIVVSLTLMLAVPKSYYCIKNMKNLKRLIAMINDEIFQPRNLHQKEIIQPNLESWNMLYMVFLSTTSTAVVLWACFPALDGSIKEGRLPFLVWFPFDTTVSPLYEIFYCYQIISLCTISLVIVNIDILLAALNMFVGAQCDLLCDNLRHTHDNHGLIRCVKHHRAILGFAENTNNFFNWILFEQFFVSVISLGLTLFQLSVVEAFSSEFCTYCFYGSAVIVQIFTYSWFGNELEIKSNNICYAVFECDWTNAPVELQKNIAFFIRRAQKPIIMSTLNLFELTLSTFLAIMRHSYSYFAVLHQVNK